MGMGMGIGVIPVRTACDQKKEKRGVSGSQFIIQAHHGRHLKSNRQRLAVNFFEQTEMKKMCPLNNALVLVLRTQRALPRALFASSDT